MYKNYSSIYQLSIDLPKKMRDFARFPHQRSQKWVPRRFLTISAWRCVLGALVDGLATGGIFWREMVGTWAGKVRWGWWGCNPFFGMFVSLAKNCVLFNGVSPQMGIRPMKNGNEWPIILMFRFLSTTWVGLNIGCPQWLIIIFPLKWLLPLIFRYTPQKTLGIFRICDAHLAMTK